MRDERGLYERLCLEGFQSGLSWLTILRKREGFRAAFAGFDPDVVARFGERDVERLLADAAIVRHRGKIEAAIANARATVALRESEPLHELFWSHAPEHHAVPAAHADWQAATPESAALAKRLQAGGVPLRRPDDGLRGDAGLRRRQRPPRGLLGAGGRRGRAISTSVLTDAVDFRLTAERRWSGVGDFKYGQWRYQLVEVCPRDLTGNRLASVGDSR